MPYDDMFQASIFGRGAKLFGDDWAGTPPDASFPRAMPQRTDLARAKALLAEAGYPNGFSTTFSFSAGLAAANEPLAALVKESLGKIGIQVEIQKLPDARANTFQAEKRLPMFVYGATAWLPETDYYMLGRYFTRDQRWNFSAFDNAELTALTEKAQFESDPVTYEAMCRRMVAIIGAEVPELFLWQPNHEAVMAKTIEATPTSTYRAARLPLPDEGLTMRGCRGLLLRLLGSLPALVAVVVVTFLLTRVLPGDTGDLLRRAHGERGIDRADPHRARARPAAAGAVLELCPGAVRAAISACR